jgi:hypothetical protein
MRHAQFLLASQRESMKWGNEMKTWGKDVGLVKEAHGYPSAFKVVNEYNKLSI